MKMKFSRVRPLAIASTVAAGLLVLSACSSADSGNNNAGGTPAEDCVPANEFSTVVDGKLTVAGIQQLPGLDVDVVSGEVNGLDSVLLVGFAAENCLEIDFQPMPGPAAVAAMTEKTADVGGGGWYRTEARGEILGQTDPIWYDQVGIVSEQEINSAEDLIGLRVAMVGGGLFEGPLTDLIGADNVVLYQSMDAIFQDLEAGRVDAAIGAGATLTIQVEDRGVESLQVSLLEFEAEYAELTVPGEPNYPYTKSNTELGEALNAYVQEARANGTVADKLAEYGLTSDFALEGPQQ